MPYRLTAAIQDLQGAVHRMVEPTDSYINNTFIRIPGLYAQLRTALAGQQGSRNGGHARSLPTVWVDAVEQLDNIDFMLDVWTRSRGHTVDQLRALAAQHWTPADVHKIRRFADIINAWADGLVKLLNHEHVRYLSAPCPVCGMDIVQKQDSAGEYVRVPALAISVDTGCTCQNELCGYYWAPNRFIDLCKQLGMPLPAGVLE
ncbi:hypothetical protein A4X20_30430 [Mycolicibacterium iranicum]|uniref:Uncharacterized protein n=2 Tax=Mycolicibacterium iranicum TaxID=912594 RepID=A0A178LBG3_MYCIR|nr:hypothetical protein A4X20_30430 [Mycolicibacterium iranicum]